MYNKEMEALGTKIGIEILVQVMQYADDIVKLRDYCEQCCKDKKAEETDDKENI